MSRLDVWSGSCKRCKLTVQIHFHLLELERGCRTETPLPLGCWRYATGFGARQVRRSGTSPERRAQRALDVNKANLTYGTAVRRSAPFDCWLVVGAGYSASCKMDALTGGEVPARLCSCRCDAGGQAIVKSGLVSGRKLTPRRCAATRLSNFDGHSRKRENRHAQVC